MMPEGAPRHVRDAWAELERAKALGKAFDQELVGIVQQWMYKHQDRYGK